MGEEAFGYEEDKKFLKSQTDWRSQEITVRGSQSWEEIGIMDSFVRRYRYGTNYNWALVEFSDEKFELPNLLDMQDASQSFQLLTTEHRDSEEGGYARVFIICEKWGVREATLLLCPSLAMSRRDQPLIRYYPYLLRGDPRILSDGALVVDKSTRVVYGHVIDTCKSEDSGYVVPIQHTLDAISKGLKQPVSLPDPLFSLIKLDFRMKENNQNDHYAQQIRQLLQARMEEKNLDALSTFHLAVSQGRIDVAEILIDAALIVSKNDLQGLRETPLEIAMNMNQERLVLIMIARGCRPTSAVIKKAEQNKQFDVLRIVMASLDMLIKRGIFSPAPTDDLNIETLKSIKKLLDSQDNTSPTSYIN
jgi:hypothetical protein